jgi:hypothetical protein
MTKKKNLHFTPAGGRPHFNIRTSSFFRHSSFVIRHSSFVIKGECREIALGDLVASTIERLLTDSPDPAIRFVLHSHFSGREVDNSATKSTQKLRCFSCSSAFRGKPENRNFSCQQSRTTVSSTLGTRKAHGEAGTL